MEIERKFLIPVLPVNLEEYPHYGIEQGYLSTSPVLRIRATTKPVLPTGNVERTRKIAAKLPSDVSVNEDTYTVVYKSGGLMAHIEETMPLTRESYAHLKTKADGKVIEKVRYVIPLEDGYRMDTDRRRDAGLPAQDPIDPPAKDLKIELDLFRNVEEADGSLLQMAEVEFPTEEAALRFIAPDWFGREVTNDTRYHNNTMSEQLS